MKNTSLRSCASTALFLALASVPLFAACGSDDTVPNPAGTAGNAGAAGGTAGNAGVAGSTPDGGGGTGGAVDASPSDGDAEVDSGNPFANSGFSIDTSIVPVGVAPQGCAGGLDTTTGRLGITLDSQASILLLGVVGGEIRANGVACTSAAGVKATVDNTSRIQIDGSAGNETVILDLSTGSFGSNILAKEGGIHIDLAGGDDSLLFRGTEQKDTVRMGKVADLIAMDVTSDSTGDIAISGVEKIVLSMGPGADEFRAGKDAGFEAATDVPLTVFGDADDDTIEGGSKDDELSGGKGDDLFDEGEPNNGADTINGGLGNNTISYERRTSAVTATLCTSGVVVGCVSPACACDADDGQAGEKDKLVNLRHIIGGAGGDSLTGTSGDDWLEGRNGDDYLYGMEGADVLSGGAGEDTLDSGPGADDVDCGAGDSDIAVVDASDKVINCELY